MRILALQQMDTISAVEANCLDSNVSCMSKFSCLSTTSSPAQALDG